MVLRNSFIPKGRFPEALLREASKKNEIIPCGAVGRALMRDKGIAVMVTVRGLKFLYQNGCFLSRIAAMIHFVFYIFLREKRLSLFDLWCA